VTLLDLLGMVAAVVTTACFLPQALQVIRTGDTRSLSLTMYVMFVFGILLWLTYGLLLNSMPIILANIFTLVQALIILYYKATERRRLLPYDE
jgi:MtN3 and saliva related transmembrane protein